MIEQGTPEYVSLAGLATATMVAAIDDHDDQVTACLRLIRDKHGAEGIGMALLMWCDSWLEFAGLRGEQDAARTIVAYIAGDPDCPEHLRPQIQWVAGCVRARADNDYAAWGERMNELAACDAAGYTNRIYAMVYIFANTFNGMPAGFGRLLGEELDHG